MTSNNQNVTGVTDTAIPAPTSGILKFDVNGIKSEKTDMTSIITTVFTADDKVPSTTATSASLLSLK